MNRNVSEILNAVFEFPEEERDRYLKLIESIKQKNVRCANCGRIIGEQWRKERTRPIYVNPLGEKLQPFCSLKCSQRGPLGRVYIEKAFPLNFSVEIRTIIQFYG